MPIDNYGPVGGGKAVGPVAWGSGIRDIAGGHRLSADVRCLIGATPARLQISSGHAAAEPGVHAVVPNHSRFAAIEAQHRNRCRRQQGQSDQPFDGAAPRKYPSAMALRIHNARVCWYD